LFILDKLLWRIFLYYFCESDGEGSENDRDHFTAGLMLNKAECGDVDDDDEGTVYKVTQVPKTLTHSWQTHTHTPTHTRGQTKRVLPTEGSLITIKTALAEEETKAKHCKQRPNNMVKQTGGSGL